MNLIGDISRVDCDITPESQMLPVQLYQLVCDDDGRDTEVDENRGQILADQRWAEIQIINEKLMTDPAYAPWTFRSFDDESLVILDCPRAFGGICVINAWSQTFIHVTNFRPYGGSVRDEIFIQPWFYLETQDTDYTPTVDVNQEVIDAIVSVRQSRFIFENPEISETINQTIYKGLNILFDLINP